MTLATGQTVICQYCLFVVDEFQPSTTCVGCAAPHHRECWNELGGCATYGCPYMVETKKVDDQVITYWGAVEKRCPVCAENIPVSALECAFCQTSFEDIRPMTLADIVPAPPEDWLANYRVWAVCLLLFSVIGITSPLTLVIGLIWYLTRTDKFRRVPTVRALVLISLGVDLVYLIVLPLGWLVFVLANIS